ncbi:MAG: hypothetical protein AAGA48_08890 [Myxococcota bacterium]
MQGDYLMDLIRGLAGLAYWLATFGQRPAQQQKLDEEAVADGKLRSMSPNVLALMSATMILSVLAVGTPSDSATLQGAQTMTEMAEEQLDDRFVRENLHQRAVVLYDRGSTSDPAKLAPYRTSATVSCDAIDALALAAEVRGCLVRVLDRLGYLARAEDHLFELAGIDLPAAMALGERLYAAWGSLPDDVLAVGGLARSEVSIGLSDLRALEYP